ncbi:MAG: hypothetical protein HY360_24855 [Verrucomicrobia bacterium]|nr:hypothetical protein [Verrucomicrobiota bacterium]
MMKYPVENGLFKHALRLALIFGMVFQGGISGGASSANERILYQTSFETGDAAPEGWTGSGSAVWANFARTGKRSLEIRTWQPDAIMDKLNPEQATAKLPMEQFWKKAAADPEATRWSSAPVEFSGKPIKVSLWAANNMTWGNDESFRAELAIERLDPDGKPTGEPLSDKAIQFPQLPRDNYQLWSRAVPEGMRWEYREATLAGLKGKARLTLHFQKFPAGQVWVDDLMVSETEGGPAAGAAKAAARTERLPWEMQINFPVSFNVFRKGDPLATDIVLIDPAGLPEPKAGMQLQYEVRDFNYRFVGEGTIALGAGPFPVWRLPAWVNDSKRQYVLDAAGGKLMKQLDGHVRIVPVELPKPVADQVGKLLFLRCALLDGKKKLAEDEVSFAVIAPATPNKDHLFRGGKVVANWQPFCDIDRDLEGKTVLEFNTLAYKCGGQWNSIPYETKDRKPYVYYGTYPELAKTPETPLELPKVEKSYPDYGIHFENYVLQMFKKGADPSFLPAWAIDASPASMAKYGYKTFNITKYAEFMGVVARHMHAMFPNAAAICPTAGEVEHDPFRFDLQKACYKAIKEKAPEVKVGAWYWQQDMSEITPVSDSLDFIDGELYGDPQGEIGQNVGALAKHLAGKTGRPIFAAALEGCAMTGSDRQEDQAKGVFDFHVRLWERGVMQLGQFEFGDFYPKADGAPLLREPLSAAVFSGTGHMGGAKRLKITRDNEAISPTMVYKGGHFQPALPTVAFANAIRFLDTAEYQRTLSTGYLVAILFERLGHSLLFLETAGGAGDHTVEISGLKSPFETLDVFGYRYRVEPSGGKTLLTIGKNPLVLTFDGANENPVIQELEDVRIGMARPIVRKSPGELRVELGKGRAGVCSVDLDARMKAPDQVKVSDERPAVITITPLEERPSGEYQTYLRLVEGGKIVGLLSFPLQVKASGIWVSTAGAPMTLKTEPQIRVTVHNATTKPEKGRVRLTDWWTTAEDRPKAVEKEIEVQADGQVSVDFPMNRERTRLNEDYDVTPTVIYPDGREEVFPARINFRAVPRARKPIKIDADLADWELDQLLPLWPNWQWALQMQQNTGPAKHYRQTWAEQTGPEGKHRMYLRWNEEGLYLAVLANNKHPSRPIKKMEDIWAQDCLYVMLYPSEYVPGGGTTMRPFKMHLAMDEPGQPVLLDGNGVVRAPEELGAEYAVKQTPEGYIFEFKMGRKYLHDLKLQPGSRFSLSTLCWRDQDPKYAFYRHCASFDGSVGDMAQFTLVDE